jgi:N6-L-threonylcarbamoyladenine synthase
MENIADAAASIQQAIVDVLVQKTVQAAELKGTAKIALAGGVAANSGLRAAISDACAKRGWALHIPPQKYCTDNAAMVGAAAYYRAQKGFYSPLSLNADPDLEIL